MHKLPSFKNIQHSAQKIQRNAKALLASHRTSPTATKKTNKCALRLNQMIIAHGATQFHATQKSKQLLREIPGPSSGKLSQGAAAIAEYTAER